MGKNDVKEDCYTLLDKQYFQLAGVMHEAFAEQDIKYAIVGGAATQARIVDAIAKKGIDPIKIHKTELRHLLRPTKDIDIATLNGSPEKMLSAGNYIANGCRVSFNPKIVRALKFEIPYNDPIFVQYQLGPEDFKGLPDAYETIVKSAEPLTLRYGGHNEIELMVARPEHIVASKLTRASEKDIIDISRLLTTYKNQNKEFNLEDVRAMLKGNNKEECYSTLEQICIGLGIIKPQPQALQHSLPV